MFNGKEFHYILIDRMQNVFIPPVGQIMIVLDLEYEITFVTSNIDKQQLIVGLK